MLFSLAVGTVDGKSRVSLPPRIKYERGSLLNPSSFARKFCLLAFQILSKHEVACVINSESSFYLPLDRPTWESYTGAVIMLRVLKMIAEEALLIG